MPVLVTIAVRKTLW